MEAMTRKRGERYAGRRPERALENVKSSAVRILGDGLIGMSESSGFTPSVSCMVCESGCARLRPRAWLATCCFRMGNLCFSPHRCTNKRCKEPTAPEGTRDFDLQKQHSSTLPFPTSSYTSGVYRPIDSGAIDSLLMRPRQIATCPRRGGIISQRGLQITSTICADPSTPVPP